MGRSRRRGTRRLLNARRSSRDARDRVRGDRSRSKSSMRCSPHATSAREKREQPRRSGSRPRRAHRSRCRPSRTIGALRRGLVRPCIQSMKRQGRIAHPVARTACAPPRRCAGGMGRALEQFRSTGWERRAHAWMSRWPAPLRSLAASAATSARSLRRVLRRANRSTPRPNTYRSPARFACRPSTQHRKSVPRGPQSARGLFGRRAERDRTRTEAGTHFAHASARTNVRRCTARPSAPLAAFEGERPWLLRVRGVHTDATGCRDR
jgi:hypothetical protein